MHQTKRLLIGLASGSTCDGVDASLVEATGVGLDIGLRHRHSLHQPYPKELRELLMGIGGTAPATPRQLGLGHRLIAEAGALAAQAVAEQAGCPLQQVQCVGFSGHHAWHETESRNPSAIELGMAPLVAERTGLTVVSDFSARDVVAGGTGTAPTALVDHRLFQHDQEQRALVHLGGLATVVFLPAGPRLRQVLGFDAGPCGILLNALIRRATSGRELFDAGGKHAVQGRCLEELLECWLGDPAIQRRPPRMVPAHLFGDEFAGAAVQQARQLEASMHDLLCTATHFVARCIGMALKRFLPEPPRRVLISGGGLRNGFLWQLLTQQLAGMQLDRIDRHGVPCGARMSVGAAGVAAMTLDGVPANLTSATGASGSRLLGSLTPGAPVNWARCLAWMGTLAAPNVAA
jgi:anhydro-N-acetylmuramic acid kinase